MLLHLFILIPQTVKRSKAIVVKEEKPWKRKRKKRKEKIKKKKRLRKKKVADTILLLEGQVACHTFYVYPILTMFCDCDAFYVFCVSCSVYAWLAFFFHEQS